MSCDDCKRFERAWSDALEGRARIDKELADLRRQLLAAMTAEGQCTEQHIWPGHERYEAMAGIVRDLAEGGDPISPGIAACAVCGGYQPGAEAMKLNDHDADCAYRRAVEFVK